MPTATVPQNNPSAPPSGLDPTVLSLAKAIRDVESQNNYKARGADGEIGAYQITPGLWNGTAKKYGIQASLDVATPQEQNAFVYNRLVDLKNQGYNPGQIASIWNSGKPDPNNGITHSPAGAATDTPAYVQNVYSRYLYYKGTSPEAVAQAGGAAPQPNLPQYGAVFPYTPNDNPLVAGAKAAGNVIPSAVNTAKGIFDVVAHPIKTAEALGKTAVGGIEKLTGAAPNENTTTFDTFVQTLKDRYGSLDALTNTAVNDPFGFGLDLVSLAAGGAGLVGKGAELADVVGQAGRMATAPLASTAGKVGDLAGGAARTATARLTGIEPSTISQILAAPNEFTAEAIATSNRADIAQTVKEAVSTRQTALAETGTGYSGIRDMQAPDLSVSDVSQKSFNLGNGKQLVYELQNAPDEALTLQELRKKVDLLANDPSTPQGLLKQSTDILKNRELIETVPHPVKVAANYIDTVLKEIAGIKISKAGKISTEGSSTIREAKDVRALQSLYDLWKPVFAKGKLTTTEFLNFRQDLAKLARYDREVSKSAPLENIADIIRGKFNTAYRKKIPGLEELDAQYAAERTQLDTLSKGLFDKDGKLTDTAINRIANATGKGKDQLLSRLEELVPGITHKIKIQKAIEDIQAASGNKVGTYTRAGEVAGALFGAGTGNIPVMATSIAALIFSMPEVAVPLLRTFGMNAELTRNVLFRLKAMSKVSPAVAAGVAEGAQALPKAPETAPAAALPAAVEGTAAEVPEVSPLQQYVK